MIKHQCSYWIQADPIPGAPAGVLEPFLEKLKNSGLLVPDGPLVADLDPENGLSLEVDPGMGTTEQDDFILDSVRDAAVGAPFLDVTYEEDDEEDRSIQRRIRWIRGKQVSDRFSRIVPASSGYDDQTVQAVLGVLDAMGHAAAAALVRREFGPQAGQVPDGLDEAPTAGAPINGGPGIVYVANPSADLLSIRDAVLYDVPESGASLYPWELFENSVRSGALTEYDGCGRLIVDGLAASNVSLWPDARMLVVAGTYLVPFTFLPTLFAGKDVKVAWWNR